MCVTAVKAEGRGSNFSKNLTTYSLNMPDAFDTDRIVTIVKHITSCDIASELCPCISEWSCRIAACFLSADFWACFHLS